MAAVLPATLIVRGRLADTRRRGRRRLRAAVGRRLRGRGRQEADAPYAAGRRDSGWVKLKPRHTFDLAVIAAEWGYGRREGWLSNLHLAARDPRTGELVMLGKTFKGLTDAVLTWQTEQFLAREVRRTSHRLHRPAAGRGDRLRRGADLDPLPRWGRAALRPGAALPGGQVRGRGRHPCGGHGTRCGRNTTIRVKRIVDNERSVAC